MKRKRCKAVTQSDSGTEHCEGFSGHKMHFYKVYKGTADSWTVRWPNHRRAARNEGATK